MWTLSNITAGSKEQVQVSVMIIVDIKSDTTLDNQGLVE